MERSISVKHTLAMHCISLLGSQPNVKPGFDMDNVKLDRNIGIQSTMNWQSTICNKCFFWFFFFSSKMNQEKPGLNNNEHDIAAQVFWSFFIPADSQAKSAPQLIFTMLPFQPHIFHDSGQFFEDYKIVRNGPMQLVTFVYPRLPLILNQLI